MKRFSTVAVSLIFAAIFAVSVSAQTGTLKVVVIETRAFEGKDGIVKYTNAMTALDKEFVALDTELRTLATRQQTLAKELKVMQDQITAAGATGKVPFDEKAAQTKSDEYATLDLTIKRKQEDGKKLYEKRQGEVLGPVLLDIGKAMQDFATAKGYDLILDGAKLDQAQLLLALNPTKADVTKEFIVFFNARPATSTSAVKPN